MAKTKNKKINVITHFLFFFSFNHSAKWILSHIMKSEIQRNQIKCPKQRPSLFTMQKGIKRPQIPCTHLMEKCSESCSRHKKGEAHAPSCPRNPSTTSLVAGMLRVWISCRRKRRNLKRDMRGLYLTDFRFFDYWYK